MKKIILIMYVLIQVLSCKKDVITEEVNVPEEINIEKLPTFTGGELIQGKIIDKTINWVFPPISSQTQLIGGGFNIYQQGEPMFILRKDTILIVIGYKGKILPPAAGANIPMSCRDDESKKIINMISFFKDNYQNYPSNFLFQILSKGNIIKSAQRNYLKNTIELKSFSLYKIEKDNKNIPVALLKLKLKVVDNNDNNIFDGNVNFCYVPRGKTCE